MTISKQTLKGKDGIPLGQSRYITLGLFEPLGCLMTPGLRKDIQCHV